MVGDLVISNPYPKLHNVARGIIPTYTGFNDTPPTSLGNATDGDIGTSTGEGVKSVTGASDSGTYVFDLGSIKTVLISAKVGFYASANTSLVTIESSNDNNVWSYSANLATGATSETQRDLIPAILTGRYIRLRFSTSGTATAHSKIYNFGAYELGI